MYPEKTKSKFEWFSNVFAVWSCSSRWRKASKFKLHIQNVLCSVKVHRRRRECMVSQSRSDIAQLLPNGRFSEAIPKAKQFYEDVSRLLAYDQVEYFCTSILQDLSSLKHQSDVHLLPQDTKEAIAGLIYAASRIGELTELHNIRSLFVQRFGLDFDKDCVDLRQGNVVSSEIVKILDTKTPENEITDIVMEVSQKYQTNIATSVDSRNEDSASSHDIDIPYSDAVRIEKMKTVVSSKKILKESSKFLNPNLEEPQGRDR